MIKESTSADMRYLFEFNGVNGSGRNAASPASTSAQDGHRDKVVNGRYSSTLNFNAFLAAVPMRNPQYVVSPSATSRIARGGGTIASYTAAPMVRDIIRRAAPILVSSRSREDGTALLQSIERQRIT